MAAELATLGSTTLARKATVLMIGFPELKIILSNTRLLIGQNLEKGMGW